MADYITMKQVPGGVVTAKDDRIVYDANMEDSGIIYGCGISYVGNNMIHIAAGYGIIKGGLFEMEDHTEYVDLAENEPTTGQIYLHLDLSADDKLTIVKETTNSLHPMVQNANANFTNGVYELQLCTFTATTTALEDVTQTFEVIQNQVLDTLPEIMANTTAGLKAGALALKEVSENLTANGKIIDYEVVDGDGVYINYKDGADTVRKKLGSGIESATLINYGQYEGVDNGVARSASVTVNTGNYTQLMVVLCALRNGGHTPISWSPSISGATDSHLLIDTVQNYQVYNRNQVYIVECNKNASVTASITAGWGTSTLLLLQAYVYGVD